jgi:hypothetical protein
VDNAIPVQGPVIPSPTVDSSVEPKSSSKSGMYLLIAFLVILILGLGGTVAYFLFFKGTDTDDTNGNGGGTVSQTCTYGGATYDAGESFDATDGCNTCSCTDGEVVCTLVACETPPVEPDTQTVEMTFDGPTGTDTYNISFIVPDGEVNVVYPDPDSYPMPYLSAASLDGGTYYIGISHPYESFYATYSSVEKRTIQNTYHELGDVYYFPIDMNSYSDSFPEITAQTHVGYGVDNRVSLTQECSDGGMSSAEPPCGRHGILGDWDDEWPFLSITCVFEKGSENLQICDGVLNSLHVLYTEK